MSPTLFRLARIGGEAKPHPRCQTPTYPAGSLSIVRSSNYFAVLVSTMAVRRQLLLFALVAAVFVFSEAFPLSPVTKLSDRFHSFHRALRRIK